MNLCKEVIEYKCDHFFHSTENCDFFKKEYGCIDYKLEYCKYNFFGICKNKDAVKNCKGEK